MSNEELLLVKLGWIVFACVGLYFFLLTAIVLHGVLIGEVSLEYWELAGVILACIASLGVMLVCPGVIIWMDE